MRKFSFKIFRMQQMSNIKSKQVILKLQKQLARQGRIVYITEQGNAFRGCYDLHAENL